MYMENISVRTINLRRRFERQKIEDFLKEHGLEYEKDVDYTLALYYKDDLIGTGSLSERVLKCIAIDPKYQGFGIFNRIITELIRVQYERGNHHIFVFTKPSNKKFFEDVGFREIAGVEGKVSLLENNPKGIETYLEELRRRRRDGDRIGAIVMNCNPFTLGHQYLIEQAARNSDVVHIFLVWENRSIFPNEVRLRLLREGTSHLDNVVIHKGKDYIISNSTFPSYFLKEKSTVVKSHAMLDVKIFAEYIVPTLGINQRFVGEEPTDYVTNEYNKTMLETLPKYNVEVKKIQRLTTGNQEIISASRVRQMIKEDRLDEVANFLPETTYRFLLSDEAKPIIKRIKES